MKTGLRESAKWLLVGLAFTLAPLGARAWDPNTGDLGAAIESGDFAAYMANLTTWLNQKAPAEPSRVSEATLTALLDDPEFAKALAQRQFIAKVGADKLGSAAKDPANREFLIWLLGSTEAMQFALEGATPVGIGDRARDNWTFPAQAMRIWRRIYEADPESKEGVNLKLAIAVGMSPPGTSPRGSGQASKPADPLDRYNHFKSAYENNELARGFADLGVWEYRQIVSSNASDEDLAWAREMVNTWRPDLRIHENVVNTTTDVWYRNSPVPHGNSYKNVLAGGGKCGPRSSWAVFINQAFGIPVVGVRQPGHACAAYRAFNPSVQPQAGFAWKVVYGRGWGASSPGQGFFEGATLRTHLQRFMQVERMRWLASAMTSESKSAVLDLVRDITETDRKEAMTGSGVDPTPFKSAAHDTSVLSAFESPQNVGDMYTVRVRGFVSPPATGEYVISIASDDDSDLFLSSNESPDNKKRIAYLRGYVGARQFNKRAETQKSDPIRLEAGKRYYIEAQHREHSGGDHLAVAWKSPGIEGEDVIQGAYLASYPGGEKGTIVREIWYDVKPSPPPVLKETPHVLSTTAALRIPAEEFAKRQQASVLDSHGGGKQVNFGMRQNAWTEYAIEVPEKGVYELTLQTAAVNFEQAFLVTVNTQKPVTVQIPNSHGLWSTTEKTELALDKGVQRLRVASYSSNPDTPVQRTVAFNWLELKAK